MSAPSPQNSCRELLRVYIERLKAKDLPWYETSSSRQYLLYHAFSLIAIGASLSTLIVASFMKTPAFADYAQVILVLLPLFGTIASTLLSQFGFREREDLRERGRIEMEDIVLSADGLLAAAKDEIECQRAYEETRKRVKTLDLSQHRADTELRAGAARQLARTPKADQ